MYYKTEETKTNLEFGLSSDDREALYVNSSVPKLLIAWVSKDDGSVVSALKLPNSFKKSLVVRLLPL